MKPMLKLPSNDKKISKEAAEFVLLFNIIPIRFVVYLGNFWTAVTL
jgi:hypothetical protein